MPNLYIYFHKDFDGIVAAALFLRINQESGLIGADSVVLKPVDYDIKKTWLKTRLEHPNVVIDFLYHPEAEWWFDHHVSTFLDARHEKKYRNSEKQFWDVIYPSCASLIKTNLENKCSLFMSSGQYQSVVDGFEEWIRWSDIIDNAKYESPAQLVEFKDPCLKINATIQPDMDQKYIDHLITAIKMCSPAEVAQTFPVKERIEDVIKTQKITIDIFKKGYSRLPMNAVVFDYIQNKIPFQRYLAYYFEPEALYSIGLYRRSGKFAISVGKNPWREFQSKNVGDICKAFGGGGRVNVGSIFVSSYKKARAIVEKICLLLSS